ncbi:hypothetical protein [Streptomyces hesseae]|uniref:Uncharacterized protein n=1 Tax=Streptomyces hesseae TaxID=3075519 RepID=A0ABU2T0D9_9ACTN|nr:hypothetical protein [Streptomyces sp. DSM 40473]MDT0453740.1 hypothetical protein [Streptomyces sp. DSM 40473]
MLARPHQEDTRIPDRLLSPPLTDSQCVHCQQPLDAAVTVAVRTDGAFHHAVCTHATCGPSEFGPLPAGQPAPVPADGYDMAMTAAAVDHGGADLPVLGSVFKRSFACWITVS